MQLEERKYLFDIQRAASAVSARTGSLKITAPMELLRSAVERQFEIIGEALSGLAKVNHEAAERTPEYRRIIAFRNILIHGYATVDDRIVWGVIENYLPALRESVTTMLNDQQE